MIELGTIRLRGRKAVYDARNKVRGLADALGYDEISSTRLATAISQAARELRRVVESDLVPQVESLTKLANKLLNEVEALKSRDSGTGRSSRYAVA